MDEVVTSAPADFLLGHGVESPERTAFAMLPQPMPAEGAVPDKASIDYIPFDDETLQRCAHASTRSMGNHHLSTPCQRWWPTPRAARSASWSMASLLARRRAADL